MGAMFHGTLTFYYSANNTACMFGATTTPDVSLASLVVLGASTRGATTSTFTSPNDFRYIYVQCGPDGGLDAVEVDPAIPAKWYASIPVFSGSEAGLYATGAPDGQYDQIGSNNMIDLNMGAPFHGQVTVYHSTASPACLVGPMDAEGNMSTIFGGTIAGATSSTFLVTEDFQYIGVMCSGITTNFELDAVEVVPVEIILDGYAVAILGADDTVKNAQATLNAPDGVYATVPALSGYIGLDLGTTFSGLLVLTHASGNPACDVYASKDPLDWAPDNKLGSMSSGLTYTMFPISTDQYPTGIRYVMIDCQPVLKGTLSLDAVRAQPAPTLTGYGLIVFGIYGTVKNQDAALMAPDGLYATIGYPGGDIALYMGASSTGTLTVYHSTTSPACGIFIWDPAGVPTLVGSTTAGAASSTVNLPGANFLYVGVSCSSLAKKASFQLDAIQVQPILP